MPTLLKLIVYCGWAVGSCWFGYWVLFAKSSGPETHASAPTSSQTATQSGDRSAQQNAGPGSTQINANQDGTNNAQNIAAPGSTQIIAPNGAVYVGAQQVDLFAGTKYTKRSIEEFFPFGYVVFAPKDGKRWLYDNQSVPELQWDVPGLLKTVQVTPDFSAGKVRWELSALNATGSVVRIMGARVGQTTTLSDGRYHIFTGYLRPNTPLPHLMTLSANQSNPVFAIGFRIPAAKELNVTIPDE